MIDKIKNCFRSDKVFYTKHARDEMKLEEFGEIRENEVFEAILNGKTVEDYPEDEPYPSCLIYGRTSGGRPLHIVCAYAFEEETAIVITVYEPDPSQWIDFERRKS